MELRLDRSEIRLLVREVVVEVLDAIDWPAGRITLTEAEAANACGVGRHVFRDLRLAGKIQARKLGRKYVYTRSDVMRDLEQLDTCEGGE